MTSDSIVVNTQLMKSVEMKKCVNRACRKYSIIQYLKCIVAFSSDEADQLCEND